MVRVLFVDDDPAGLQPVMRLLRRKADAWAMTFVDGATAALAKLDSGRFDVVVCGELPRCSIKGSQLLRYVELRRPEMARMLLAKSVPAPHEAAPVHAFMLLPVEDDLLCDVIDELAQCVREARLPARPAMLTSQP